MSRREHRGGASERWGLAGVTLAGLAARFPGLGELPPSVDETFTWQTATTLAAGKAGASAYWAQLDAPLFTLVSASAARVGGDSMLALRVPAAIFGVLAVGFFFAAIRRHLSSREALLATALAALSPFLIYYARTARPYAQVLCFCMAFVWAWYATDRWHPLARGVLLVALTALAVASHYMALVFFTAFYALELGSRGRRHILLRDFSIGCVSAAVGLLITIPALLRLQALQLPYWTLDSVTLPGIYLEQVWFAGTTLPGGGWAAGAVNVGLCALLALPFVLGRLRGAAAPRVPLALVVLGFAAPALLTLPSLVSDRGLLFYARGFIASSPFLFTYAVVCGRAMPGGVVLRAAWATVLLAPFLVSSVAVATNRASHPYLRDRDALVAIGERVQELRPHYDVAFVHHWYLVQLFDYYDTDGSLRAIAAPDGAHSTFEAALTRDLEALRDDQRVLLVLNGLAREADPQERVRKALGSRRNVVDELPCHTAPVRGLERFCERLVLFGAAR